MADFSKEDMDQIFGGNETSRILSSPGISTMPNEPIPPKADKKLKKELEKDNKGVAPNYPSPSTLNVPVPASVLAGLNKPSDVVNQTANQFKSLNDQMPAPQPGSSVQQVAKEAKTVGQGAMDLAKDYWWAPLAAYGTHHILKNLYGGGGGPPPPPPPPPLDDELDPDELDELDELEEPVLPP